MYNWKKKNVFTLKIKTVFFFSNLESIIIYRRSMSRSPSRLHSLHGSPVHYANGTNPSGSAAWNENRRTRYGTCTIGRATTEQPKTFSCQVWSKSDWHFCRARSSALVTNETGDDYWIPIAWSQKTKKKKTLEYDPYNDRRPRGEKKTRPGTVRRRPRRPAAGTSSPNRRARAVHAWSGGARSVR